MTPSQCKHCKKFVVAPKTEHEKSCDDNKNVAESDSDEEDATTSDGV